MVHFQRVQESLRMPSGSHLVAVRCTGKWVLLQCQERLPRRLRERLVSRRPARAQEVVVDHLPGQTLLDALGLQEKHSTGCQH